MLIQTKFLGEVEIKESEILTFKQGLPGFPDDENYILLALDTDLPLAFLQSTEHEEISFIVAFPFAFDKEYVFDISTEDKAELQIVSEEDVIVYNIVTLKEAFSDSTINLLAPIVINNTKKLGKQIVLQDSANYPLRYPIGLATAKGSAK